MKKTLLALALACLLLPALTLVAQGGPPPGGGPPGAGPQGPPPEAVLKELFAFTDEQLAGLRTLMDTRRQASEALGHQIQDAEHALQQAMQAATPDPATVGTAFINVNTLRKQFLPIDEAFRTGFTNLLTADQKSKLDAYKGIETAMRVVGALHQLGI